MSAAKKPSRGRPQVADNPMQVGVRVDATVIAMAEELAKDLTAIGVAGMRTTRNDVLRGALTRGVKEMRREVDERMKVAP